MKAAKTDGNQQEIVDALRKAGAIVWLTHRVGGGFPDLVVGYRGTTLLLEVKQPGVGRMNDNELEFFKAWTGGHCYVTDSAEHALSVLEFIQGPEK